MAIRTTNAATLDYMRARGIKAADPVPPGRKPTKGQPVDDGSVDDEEGEFDKDGNPLPPDPSEMTDEEAEEETDKLKAKWQGLIRAEVRSSGCNPTVAMSRVGKRHVALRNRMIDLANRPKHSSRSRSRSRR